MEMIEFAMHLTGHDEKTVRQMYLDWSLTKEQKESKPEISPYRIISEVCADYDISIRQLRTKTRKKDRVQARYIACKLLREFTKLTEQKIADATGLGKHSTVNYGLKKITYQIGKYDDVRKKYQRIKNELSTI